MPPIEFPASLDSSLSQGFILQVKVYVSPDRVAEFLNHFNPIFKIVVAEPECRFFVVGQDAETPGCISWTEGWSKDAQWFMDVQIKKDYYKDYLAVTEAMFVKPREVTILTPQANMLSFKIPQFASVSD